MNDSQTIPVQPFQLLWTVGFSGKRSFDSSREKEIQTALRQVIDDLGKKAAAHNAGLTTISSIARGGDVLFAETVRASDNPLPWKCLLPFSQDEFIDYDLQSTKNGNPLPIAEREKWRNRVDNCLKQSLPAPEVTSTGIDPTDDDQRDEAYLECGHRIVAESDVMVFLLREEECNNLVSEKSGMAIQQRGFGTFAVACYAHAAGLPMILLNVDAPNISATKTVLNKPEEAGIPQGMFYDPVVTKVILAATQPGDKKEIDVREEVKILSGPITPVRLGVVKTCAQLSVFAIQNQKKTLGGLITILRLHLAASALAALAATVLQLVNFDGLAKIWLILIALLALAKPGLAFIAWLLESLLHHRGNRNRETWLNARVLAELCRGFLATWPLPLQPLDARDEEDFPKFKRLIRSLRLLREQDTNAAIQGTLCQPRESKAEANMREACAGYIKERLRDQAHYYREKHSKAKSQALFWRIGFIAATWLAIILGLVLAGDRILILFGSTHFLRVVYVERILEATIIIMPFVAAHCIGMSSIMDTHRRCRRYSELSNYLERLSNTLERTDVNPSRIRLIEHAERMLIEEQHEWFSATRNLSV